MDMSGHEIEASRIERMLCWHARNVGRAMGM